MFAKATIVASSFVALVAAAPLSPRQVQGMVFNNTWPGNTVFGPFSAVQKFDPKNTWFTGCGYSNYTGQFLASIKSNNTYSNKESCGQSIEITNTQTGSKVVAMIVDECLQCAYDYLRLSPAAYDAVADDRLANFTGTYVVSNKTVPAPAWPATVSANVWPAPSSSSWAPAPSSSWASPSSSSSWSSSAKPTSSWTPSSSSWTPSSSSWTPSSSSKWSSSSSSWTPSSSSQQWTPTPSSSSKYVAPSTSSTYQAPKTTQQSSSNNNNNNNGGGSSGGWEYYGTATWYTQDGNAGACGQYHGDYDYIVALDTAMYANGAHCGQKITLENTANGKSVTAIVADECPSCDSATSVDLSLGVFSALANLNDGVFNLAWKWA